MIVASGLDIVKISRIEKLLEKKRGRFLKKIFTIKEKIYIKEKLYKPETVSGIFASKEAVSKLLGTGLGKVNWKDIEILHHKNGKPYVKLYNEAEKVREELKINKINLSISHEREYALAIAIGESYENNKKRMIPQKIKNLLPSRDRWAHKGDFGRVGIISGSTGMSGATYLSTMGALKTGSGLVYAIVPKSLNMVLANKLIEAIIMPVEDRQTGHFNLDTFDEIKKAIEDMDVLAIGPGIGVDEERIELIEEILLNYKKTIVLDADGINCLSKGDANILRRRKARTILTPHLGELSRLLGVSIDEIRKNLIEYSRYISNKYKIIIVLKGKNTIVCDEEGEIYINSTGNPGMATAGSGDILTGIIASFVGQGIDPYDAAVLGVYSHGLAGDLAKETKGEYGMIARDILNNIPYSIKNLQE